MIIVANASCCRWVCTTGKDKAMPDIPVEVLKGCPCGKGERGDVRTDESIRWRSTEGEKGYQQ